MKWKAVASDSKIVKIASLIDLRDVGGALGHTTGLSAGHAASASALVHLDHDGVADSLELLHLGIELVLLSHLVVVQPLEGLVDGLVGGLGVGRFDLVLDVGVVEGVLHGEAVVLETVLGLDLLLDGFIISLVLLGFVNHAVDLILGQATLLVGDGDLAGLAGCLVHGGHIQDTVGINVECDLDLGDTAGGRRDTIEMELTEQVVVLGHGTLTFEDLDQHTRLVVSVGGEGLGFLGRNGGVALDELGHDTTSGLKTHGQRSNIQKQQVLDGRVAATGEDGSLDGGTVGDSLIGVDGTVWLLAVEELLDELLDLRDTSGTTDKHDIVDLALVETGVAHALLARSDGVTEVVHAELLEASAGKGARIINAIEQGVDLDGGLGGRRKSALGALALGAETTKGTLVRGHILSTVLALEILDTEFDDAVVEILTTKMGVTSGGLDFEDTVFNGENGNIESAAAHIEDEDVALAGSLLVKTVGNGRGGGFVDDTKDVETSDGTGILGGLTLGIVEIGRDRDDGIGDGAAQVGLGGLLHLGENHGGDLLGMELLVFAHVVNADQRLLGSARFELERPQFHVGLDILVGKLTTDQTLGVEDGVGGVARNLIFGGIPDQTFGVGESHVGWGSTVTLIIRDDFDGIVLPDANAGIGGTKIDTDSGDFSSRHGC